MSLNDVIEKRLQQLGLVIPEPSKPVAAYLPARKACSLVFISGQLPFKDGQLLAAGKVPSQVSLEQAQLAAQQCMLNGLAALRHHLGGDWLKLRQIVRVGVFVQCDDGYGDQPKVANGASDLLVNLLGELGRHARVAVGVNALPLNAAVEVEMIAEVG